jgi:hypothetical protein
MPEQSHADVVNAVAGVIARVTHMAQLHGTGYLKVTRDDEAGTFNFTAIPPDQIIVKYERGGVDAKPL